MTELDLAFMERAIELSRQGLPAPNPRVGCVIVRNGEVVGEGFHNRAGEAHAEAAALVQAGERAKGSTVYVTLEPCAHHGRTPPCADALIAAGVLRVVVAVEDPNPVAQGGVERLRDAGIAVDVGLLAPEASAVNERFLAAMRVQRPFVMVKAAISLDGRIALPTGESRWITGEGAREAGRRLRAEMGAVLVGPGTVLADDPQLTYRGSEPFAVTRVVLDPRRALPPTARVFDGSSPTIHVVPSPNAGPGKLAIDLVDGRFPIPELLKELFDLGHTGLLVEGGGKTIGSFLQAGCVDAIELFVAPKVLGAGPSWAEGLEVATVADSPQFELMRMERLDADTRLSFRRPGMWKELNG